MTGGSIRRFVCSQEANCTSLRADKPSFLADSLSNPNQVIVIRASTK